MIHWKNLDCKYSDSYKAAFRQECCKYARKHPDGTCDGYGRSPGDDEPCSICKECDRHWTYREEKGIG